MKFFDEQQLKYWQTCRKISIAVFVCACLLLIGVAVLSILFLERWDRAVSQTICTASVALLACGILFFVRLNFYFSHIIDICNTANKLQHQTYVGVADVESGVTTYRFLPFHAVTIHTEAGDICVYLQQGELKENVVYSFSVCQRIICSFEELL